MKKSMIILMHMGFWACYFILVLVILAILFGSDPTATEEKTEFAFNVIFHFAIIPSILAFYGFYFLVFPKYVQTRQYAKAAIIGLLIAIACAVSTFMDLTYNFGESCGEPGTLLEVLAIGGFIAFIAALNGVIALVIRACITWFSEVRLREELAAKNHDMELALVKAQLDPHFLFNTINNIDVLILKDAEKASNYLNSLSEIMRFMLFKAKKNFVPLSTELAYIEKYIDLQKIRTANESYVHYQVQGSPGDRMIAPMIFIPFIENAFKHCTSKKLEDAIQVKISIEDSGTKMQCVNKFELGKPKPDMEGGLGNGLMRKRLDLLYPNQYELEVRKAEGQYSVDLKIENG